MYDKLWSNGNSHSVEMFDYTFDEAFGKAMPVHLKREELHSYIIGRVQKNCDGGDFFAKYVRFLHSVDHVSYDKDAQQFTLRVTDLANNTVTSHSFDKCLWACGENGKMRMPESTVKMFRDGGFQGTIMHSAEAANAERFENSVAGKRILLIGGGYSAEDLTLQAVKVGVEKVFICSRDSYADPIGYFTDWPDSKVEVLPYQTPFFVSNEGTCIQFHEVTWSPDGYKRHGSSVSTKLRNIDTVIFCTGYDVNLSMLEKDLNEGFPMHNDKISETVAVPKDWKMPENPYTTYVGDVPPSENVRYVADSVHPRFYHGVLISNPNMMFLVSYGSDLPLLASDIYAWLFAGYVTGRIELPSVAEMKRRNQDDALHQLAMPYFRYQTDDNYWKAIDSLNIWPDVYGESCPPWDECADAAELDSMQRLAAVAYEAKYPFQIGTREELNENGKQLVAFGMEDYNHRWENVPTEDEKDWRTFRDDTNTERFFSLFTGTKAVALSDRWMNIDNEPATKKDQIE
jgi:L-lysine 6-monooxygenase (NADPH-requiring)